MFVQLLIGSLVVALSVGVAAVFMGSGIRILTKIGPWLSAPPHAYKSIIALIGVTLWLLAAASASVWVWAIAYIILGLFDTLEPALYFSVVSFTTLGFGDITLPPPWRILSGISAANGLLLFGLSTAFLVEFFARLQAAQSNARLAGK